MRLLAATVTILLSSTLHAVEDYRFAQFEPLYTAETIYPNRIATQYAPVPPNETWVRVRHMGDVGTEELTQQAANSIGSDRSARTGLAIPFFRGFSPDFYQRGYRDEPELGTNVYQVYGRAFGWQLNTFQFSHEYPIECPPAFPECGGGPNIVYGRAFEPGLNPWTTPSSEFTMQVYLKLPTVRYVAEETTPAAQVSFLYYLQHTETGFLIAGLINLFDTRPFPEVGRERVGSDGVTGFVSSDLRDRQPDASPYRYMTRSPFSQPGANRWRWTEERFFRAHVSRDQLAAIIADTQAPGRPEEYRVIEASILIESFPRRTGDSSVAGSFRDFELYRAHDGD